MRGDRRLHFRLETDGLEPEAELRHVTVLTATEIERMSVPPPPADIYSPEYQQWVVRSEDAEKLTDALAHNIAYAIRRAFTRERR
jgi:hypothetical protein